MIKSIPLFPLELIVFPHSKYPLHIFEDRYKKLISNCLSSDTGFGIVAKIGNKLQTVGSYVDIVEITKRYEKEEMDIVVLGARRFLIRALEKKSGDLQIAKAVDYDDFDSNFNEKNLILLMQKFERVIRSVKIELEESFWHNLDLAKYKSFKIAEKAGLSLEQQQVLLNLRFEQKRLKFLYEHLNRIEPMIEKNSIIRKMVEGDGYIN